MKFLNILFCIGAISIADILYAQSDANDPGWQWARSSNIENTHGTEEIRTNFNNDIYVLVQYNDTLVIEDTAFFHSGGYAGYQDFKAAVIKRNSSGDFIKAVDIFSPQNKKIYYTDMELDAESNVYVYGTFEDTLFVNDTLLLPDHPGYSYDIFLLKLDKDFNFRWAKKISSPDQDACGYLDISNDQCLYISMYTMTGGHDTVHEYVDFFKQRKVEILTGLISLVKLDTSGNIIWLDEIRKPNYGYTFLRNTIVGEDGNIYVAGNAQDNDLYIQGDTLHFPDDPDYANDSFILKFGPDGSKLDAYFFDFKEMTPVDQWMCVDRFSNYYLSCVIFNSMYFGDDYIDLPANGLGYMVAKMDPGFHPQWCKVFVSSSTGTSQYFQLNLVNDSVAFALYVHGTFTFLDSTYHYNLYGRIFTGIFSPDGNLDEFQMITSNLGMVLGKMGTDNCKNMLLEGRVQGITNFDEDTISVGYGYHSFLAKNNRYPVTHLSMSGDTTVCGPVVLFAPEGYLYYQWNDVLSENNWILADNTGNYRVKAANGDGCWAEGATDVKVYLPFEFSLGMDTTILASDTLQLNAPQGYEHYIWSTGDTLPGLVMPAKDLQIGNNLIWLDIFDGPCNATDTILIRVVDDSGIPDPIPSQIILYPNPAGKSFRIIAPDGKYPQSIIIFDWLGQQISKDDLTWQEIDVTGFEKGVYIVALVFREMTVYRKLIVD